ncbi:MAG: cytochrome c [Nitrospinota bacterium]|nr:cytochrome c [Nitrospinota bacterium]
MSRNIILFLFAMSASYFMAGEAVAGAKWGAAVPEGAGKSVNAAVLKRAKDNYKVHCSTCHGVNGDGNGELAESLGEGVKPRNHTDAKIMSARKDEQIADVITNGGEAMGFNSAMPPFGTVLSGEEIKGLVEYIRVLCKCRHE